MLRCACAHPQRSTHPGSLAQPIGSASSCLRSRQSQLCRIKAVTRKARNRRHSDLDLARVKGVSSQAQVYRTTTWQQPVFSVGEAPRAAMAPAATATRTAARAARAAGATPAAPPPAADAEALFAALQHNWRTVASTDNLSLLAEEEAGPGAESAARPPPLLPGAALVLAGVSLLAWGVFSLVVSKLMPPSGVAVIAAVQRDRYYCLLAPLMLPVTLIAVTANWFSLKLFKHNS
ncbi:MAG: phosphatidylinositol N-acetylglucosaminyltransferase subunit Y-domain-containing protein [Monoraphidium minutum]|nr:MAG: phosphatidylinositol N-acetylglucosaminyltransferase subunit Y-domain-containing protein [Monoraphidium minutum]